MTAVVKSTGLSVSVAISNNKGRLTSDQIEVMRGDAARFTADDWALRRRVEAQRAVENLAYAIRDAVHKVRTRCPPGASCTNRDGHTPPPKHTRTQTHMHSPIPPHPMPACLWVQRGAGAWITPSEVKAMEDLFSRTTDWVRANVTASVSTCQQRHRVVSHAADSVLQKLPWGAKARVPLPSEDASGDGAGRGAGAGAGAGGKGEGRPPAGGAADSPLRPPPSYRVDDLD